MEAFEAARAVSNCPATSGYAYSALSLGEAVLSVDGLTGTMIAVSRAAVAIQSALALNLASHGANVFVDGSALYGAVASAQAKAGTAARELSAPLSLAASTTTAARANSQGPSAALAILAQSLAEAAYTAEVAAYDAGVLSVFASASCYNDNGTSSSCLQRASALFDAALTAAVANSDAANLAVDAALVSYTN